MARKQKNIHYIYKTTCNVTGRWYIGMHSTCNLEDGYMGSGTVLRRSIRKYGVENHSKEILELFPSREELVLREQEIVNKELIGDGKCMNIKEGGIGGFSSYEHMVKCSKAGNEKLKELKKDNYFLEKYKKNLSKTIKKAFSEGKMRDTLKNLDWNGKRHSDETKQLMSEKRKGTGTGETNSQFGTCWITKDGVNKKIKKEDLGTYLKEGWLKGRK